MWRGEPLKRARGNLERFGYSGTSEEVSIKYGRYGLLCFFLSTRYTRIHMNMVYNPDTPHFLICLQVSHTFGHQGLIRVTFCFPEKERKKAWVSCGCGPSVLCVMNEWQKWDLKSYSPILFWDVMSLSSPLLASPPQLPNWSFPYPMNKLNIEHSMMMIGESIEAHGSHKHPSQVLSQIKSKSWGWGGERGGECFVFFGMFPMCSHQVPKMSQSCSNAFH